MEALDQRGQHSLHLVNLPRQSAKILVRQEIEIMSKEYVIFRFARGSTGYLQEATNLIIRPSPRTFRDVRSNGGRGTAQLARQTVELFFRKSTSRVVNIERHAVRFLPYGEFFIVLHKSPPIERNSSYLIGSLAAHSSLLIAQKLFTKFLPGICLILPASSSSKRAAKISEEESCDSSFSTIWSMWVASSAFSRLRMRRS